MELCTGTPVPSIDEAMDLDFDAIQARYPRSARHLRSLFVQLYRRDLPIAGFWS
jgi:hypothetical protein